MSKKQIHKVELYNTLLTLSRNIFFYKSILLPDTFQTRIHLMLMHFAILMIISKKKKKKFDQDSYDFLFHSIEYNLREQGLGDVTVNKNMKKLNNILYDILLKLDISKDDKKININSNILLNYFVTLNKAENSIINDFSQYFNDFFNFCFEIPLNNMIDSAINFKHYGSSKKKNF